MLRGPGHRLPLILLVAAPIVLVPLPSLAQMLRTTPAAQCGNFPLLAERALAEGAGAAVGTRIRGEAVDSPDGTHYILRGNVELRDAGRVLRAGSIDWVRDTGAFTAADDIRFEDGTLILRTPAMQGNSRTGAGSAKAVEFQFLDSPGNGRAEAVDLFGTGHSRLEAVRYSTCSPERPQWELRAGRIDLDHEREAGYARNATMRVGGVPVLWLPWVRFPISDRRQSGLLYPSFGYSAERGFDFVQPWYLNLAPNYDATLYPRIVGRRGAMLGAEFRYLGTYSQGSVRGDYLAHDRRADRSRGLLRARSTTRLGPDWRFNVNLNHVSDRRYFEDLGDGLYSNATQLLRSTVYLDGRGQNWRAAVGADQFQITDPDLPAGFEPYKRLPRAIFNARGRVGSGLQYGIDSEFVSFRKDTGLDGRRLDLEPWVDWTLHGPWWYFNPRLGYRVTEYRLDRANDASPSRALPIASLDTGLVFERNAHWFGSPYVQTLEPRLFWLRAPWRDQSDIPIFDTSVQTFDYWQLFSRNRFSGADRQMNANNLTFALTSRLLDGSGVERASASLGQIRYFEPQRVQMPGRVVTDFTRSAWVAQFGSRLSERWNLNLAQQWDPERRGTDLSTVSLQHRGWNASLLNVSYRYRRNYLEQVDVSGLYPLNERWNLLARWNWALDQRRTLEALGGVEYASCCLAVRLVARHYVRNSLGALNNSIMLEVEFRGLGSAGQQAGNLLQHAILGYRRGDLAEPGEWPPLPGSDE